MVTIKKNESTSTSEIENFLLKIGFELPMCFIEFFSQSNGGLISGENIYIELWPLTEMIELNKNYEADKYAPGYFIFGTDGGGTAYWIEKETGYIFEREFIAMPEDVVFICKSFDEFLQKPFAS